MLSNHYKCMLAEQTQNPFQQNKPTTKGNKCKDPSLGSLCHLVCNGLVHIDSVSLAGPSDEEAMVVPEIVESDSSVPVFEGL